METTVILEFVGAFFAAAMAIGVAVQTPRSIAHWFFTAGMAGLALESLCLGLSANAFMRDQVIYWQNWSFFAMSLLPGVWVLFSLTYARGNARAILTKWRFPLAAAALAPVVMVFLFSGHLVALRQIGVSRAALDLTIPGLVLNIVFLSSAILILMNLERTFRASVGTMRWRVKFMVLGLGVLFVVRAYTSSQLLLFRSIDSSLQALNSAALLAACLLILRSLFRTGHFEVSVYPSHSVLHNSFTVLLAGVYLIVVGALAKLVSMIGATSSFPLKAFLVLVSLVLLSTILL
jgi:hypothetical protein